MSTSIATRAMPDCFHMALYSVKCTGACTRAPSRYRLMVAGTCWLATLFHGSMLTCLILNFVMFGNESRDFLATVGIVQFYPWPAWAYRWTFMESNVCTYIYIYMSFINILKSWNISYVYFIFLECWLDTQTVSTYLSRHTWNLHVCANTDKT